MAKYYRITETREFMEEAFGYLGKYDEGDIVQIDPDYEDDHSFVAHDEDAGDSCWISKDHAEEVDVNDLRMSERSEEDQMIIYMAHINREEIQVHGGFGGTWEPYSGNAISRHRRYRVVTPELLRVEAIKLEMAVLTTKLEDLEKTLEEANDAVYAAQHAA